MASGQKLLLSMAATPAGRTLVLHHIVIQNLLNTLMMWCSDGVPRQLTNELRAQMQARGLAPVPDTLGRPALVIGGSE